MKTEIITAASEKRHETQARLRRAWQRERNRDRELETEYEKSRRLEALRDYD